MDPKETAEMVDLEQLAELTVKETQKKKRELRTALIFCFILFGAFGIGGFVTQGLKTGAIATAIIAIIYFSLRFGIKFF